MTPRVEPAAPADAPHGDLVAAARAAGLRDAHAPVPLFRYLARAWRVRDFVAALAGAQLRTATGTSRLGPAWLVLTPVLNGLVFWAVFGVLLGAGRSVPNYVGFLLVGVFLYQFTSRAVIEGAKAVQGNARLIQAFSFPRIVLPVASSLRQATAQLVAVGAMLLIVLAVPPVEDVTWRWLLAPPLFVLQALFNTGLGLVFARLIATVPDAQNLLTFGLRLWMYLAGVFFDARERAEGTPLAVVVALDPVHAFLEANRDVLLYGRTPPVTTSCVALGWTVALLVVGVLVFWQGERRYGRD